MIMIILATLDILAIPAILDILDILAILPNISKHFHEIVKKMMGKKESAPWGALSRRLLSISENSSMSF